MRKIQNSQELSKYYHKISECVDDYIKNHRVKPSEIWTYIKRNFDKFLEKYNLSDIENIDRIVLDVLEHRKHMEMDNVFFFEQFASKLNESFLSSSAPTIEHEKILADFFETSVGHVEILDKTNHLFKVRSFDENINAVIYSEEEIDSMKKSILEKLTDEIYSNEISINSIGNINLNFEMRFPLSEIFTKDQLKIKEISDLVFLRIISKILVSSFDTRISFYRQVPQKFKNFYIWEVRSDSPTF